MGGASNMTLIVEYKRLKVSLSEVAISIVAASRDGYHTSKLKSRHRKYRNIIKRLEEEYPELLV